MITFERLAARPRAFTSLCGLSLSDFEALYQDFTAFYAKDRRDSPTRKAGQPRRRAAGAGVPPGQACRRGRRAAGAGAPFSQDGRTRLLMALIWLRAYPTYEVLAFFFCLHKANAQRGVADVLATLSAHTLFTCERSASERQKVRDRNCARCRRSWMPSPMCAW